jgi:hypothetical protein
VVDTKGVTMNDAWERLPEHVKRYLVERMLSDIPEGALETLASLSPEEIAVLDKVGASFEEEEVQPKQYAALIH